MKFDFKLEVTVYNILYYYHLLDQYIPNKKLGSNGNVVANHINKLLSDNQKLTFLNDIIFASFYVTNNDKITIEHLRDINDRKKKDDIIDISFSGAYSMYMRDYKKKLEKLLHNKYIIIPITLESHATALLLFKHNDFYYLSLINSGKYLDYHDMYTFYHKPYKFIYGGNDISVILDILIFINYIILNNEKVIEKLNLEDINYLHSYIKNSATTVRCSKISDKKFISMRDYYIYISNFLNTIKIDNVEKIMLKYNIDGKIIKYNKPYVQLYNLIININNFYNENNIYSIKLDKIYFNKLGSIYNGDTDEQIIDNINKKCAEHINNRDIKHIINPLIFHINGHNICILPQKSGSCAWFSIYWTVLLYALINTDKYIDTISNLLINSISYMKTIFIHDNFNKELLNEKSSIVLMNIVHSKLINLNILEDNKFIIDIYKLKIIYDKSSEHKLVDESTFFKKTHHNNFNAIISEFINNYEKLGNTRVHTQIFTNTNTFYYNICNYIKTNNTKYNYTNNYNINDIIQYYIDNTKKLINELDNIQTNSQYKNIQIMNEKFFNKTTMTLTDLISKYSKIDDNIKCRFNEIIKFHNEYKMINYDNINRFTYHEYYNYNIIKYYNNINNENIIQTKTFTKLIIIFKIINIMFKMSLYENVFGFINDFENNARNENIQTENLLSNLDTIKKKFKKLKNELLTNCIINFTPEPSEDEFISVVKNIEYNVYYVDILNVDNSLINLSSGIKYNYFNDLNIFNYNFDTSVKCTQVQNNIINDINLYTNMEINIKYIDNEIKYLLTNPSYIFNNYLHSKYFTKYSLFIKLNINTINTDQTLKNKLLFYFIKLYMICGKIGLFIFL